MKLLIMCEGPNELAIMRIRKYKKLKGSHKKDEFYLADLLKIGYRF